MKIKRAFLEYDDGAGMGWVISGKLNEESGYKFWPTLLMYIKKRNQWKRFIS